jgi:hypothetical protein
MTRITAGSVGEVPTRSAPQPEAAGVEAAIVGAQTRGDGECPRAGSRTISSAPGPEPSVRRGGCVTASSSALIGCTCWRGQEALLTCWLCAKVWMTCGQQHLACACAVEMLGIPVPGRTQGGPFTWGKRQPCLCMQRNPELSTCRAVIYGK